MSFVWREDQLRDLVSDVPIRLVYGGRPLALGSRTTAAIVVGDHDLDRRRQDGCIRSSRSWRLGVCTEAVEMPWAGQVFHRGYVDFSQPSRCRSALVKCLRHLPIEEIQQVLRTRSKRVYSSTIAHHKIFNRLDVAKTTYKFRVGRAEHGKRHSFIREPVPNCEFPEMRVRGESRAVRGSGPRRARLR